MVMAVNHSSEHRAAIQAWRIATYSKGAPCFGTSASDAYLRFGPACGASGPNHCPVTSQTS